jgi:outer membrane protein assembly factor BamD (BamD/ComL family)
MGEEHEWGGEHGGSIHLGVVMHQCKRARIRLQALVVAALSWIAAATASAAELPANRVAVLPFAVEGKGASETDGVTLAELISGELVTGGRHLIVERIQLDKAVREIRLQGTDQIDPATAVAVGRHVGAQTVVIGTLSGESAEGLVLGRFLDVETGTVFIARTENIRGRTLLAVAQKLVQAFEEDEERLASAALQKADQQAALGRQEAGYQQYGQLAQRFARTSAAPRALLSMSRLDLNSAKFAEASDHATGLLETFPNSELAEEALFILAEAQYRPVFGLDARDPDQMPVPSETWKKVAGDTASVLTRVRDRAKAAQVARRTYERLLSLYPQGAHAAEAHQRLEHIAQYGGR